MDDAALAYQAYVHVLEARIGELAKLEDAYVDLQKTLALVRKDCMDPFRTGLDPCCICERPTYWEYNMGYVVNALMCEHSECITPMVYCCECTKNTYGTTYIGSSILCHRHLARARRDDVKK